MIYFLCVVGGILLGLLIAFIISTSGNWGKWEVVDLNKPMVEATYNVGGNKIGERDISVDVMRRINNTTYLF